ncbi:MAG: DNA-binding response regulator, partial [Aurantimonas coralicida]|nr:DNA-binding response regulator [Aurantimonas coralicida]
MTETKAVQRQAPSPLGDDAPHILVIDDDRRIRSLLLRFLSEQQFRVSVAADAAEARRILEGLD